MTEQQLQSKMLTWLKAHKYYAVKIVLANRAGTPDILCCMHGKFVAIECKAERGAVSVLQEHTAALIRKSGGYAVVVRPSTFASVCDWLLSLQ